MRGKYFGISTQPHVAEIAYSVAKEQQLWDFNVT